MIEDDTKRVCDLIKTRIRKGGRTIVAIAGPPASGKSTVAEAVVRKLNADNPSQVPHAALLPMDGYHLDNRLLEARGLLSRKGAPESFDAIGFCKAVRDLVSAEHERYHPKFDRQMDLAIANAIPIHPETPVIIAEGNYLLLNQDPWASLQEIYAATVFVSPTMDDLVKRLKQRWISHGFDQESAMARTTRNDLPNAELILKESRGADLFLNQNYTEFGVRYAF